MWNPYLPVPARRRRWLGLSAVAAVVIVWAVITGLGLVGPNKLPAPWAAGKAFLYLAWDAETGRSLLLTAMLWSVGRVLAAGLLVVAIGVPVGVMMGASPYINACLSPLVDPFRSAPIVALLPILVMWLGIGEAMKIVFCFSVPWCI